MNLKNLLGLLFLLQIAIDADSARSSSDLNKNFFQAILSRDYSTAKGLLKKGADINYQEPTYGFTALMLAIRGESISKQELRSGTNLEFAKFLLEAGANPDIKSTGGNLAITYAAACRNIAFAQDIPRDTYDSPLMERKKCKEIFKLLLRSTAKGNLRHKNEFSILHASVLSKSIEIIGLAYDAWPFPNGHQIGWYGASGHTPLTLAITSAETNEKDSLRIIQFLLNKGALPQTYVNTCSDGCSNDTPLTLAIRNKNTEIIKLLLANHVPLESTCFSGPIYEGAVYDEKTPFTLAVDYESLEIADLLLKYGANINYRDSYGFSALEIAIQRANLDFVKFLVQNKIDLKNRTILAKSRNCYSGLCTIEPNSTSIEIAQRELQFSQNDTAAAKSLDPTVFADKQAHFSKMIDRFERKASNLQQIITYLKSQAK